MKCRHSLQKSIISFFVLTCVVLVVGYTFFLSNYLRRGFELFVEFRLEETSTNYLKEYARNPDVPLPDQGHIKGYAHFRDLPLNIRNNYDAQQLRSDPFAYLHVGKSHYKIHSLTRPDGTTIYLVYYSLEGELSESAHRKFDFYYFYTPALGGLLSIIAVLALAFVLFKRIANPVESLHKWTISLSPENLDKEPRKFKYDELDNVAQMILATSRRLTAGMAREKRFHKYASHELRTPIAIIQNNLELMERQGITQDNRYKSSHKRMTKAVRNMKHLTVALLWLSREMESPLPEQDVRIDDCIREIIGENDYLMEGKQVSLITDLQPVTLRTPPTLAHIILTNLVRNAFQHSCDGEIRISNSPGGIEVANRIHSSGENDTASNDGYGLGLQLSQQLVDKIGWKIEVAEEDGQFLIRVLTSQADTPII